MGMFAANPRRISGPNLLSGDESAARDKDNCTSVIAHAASVIARMLSDHEFATYYLLGG